MTYLNDMVFDKDQPLELLKMYIIVRKSLNMSPGKIAGQVGHAVDMIYSEYHDLYCRIHCQGESLPAEEADKVDRINDWLSIKIENKYKTKVVLVADEKDWAKIKEDYNPHTVVDAGKTEVDPGTETVMVLYPMLENERSKTLKRLRLL